MKRETVCRERKAAQAAAYRLIGDEHYILSTLRAKTLQQKPLISMAKKQHQNAAIN